MDYRQKRTFLMFGTLYLGYLGPLASPSTVADNVMRVGGVFTAAALVGLALKGDPEVKRQRELEEDERQLEERKAKIAELEKDLGYEPLNLHEIHDAVMEHNKEDNNRG